MIAGWDISTSIVGLSLFQNDGTYESSSYLDLRRVDGLLVKADRFKEFLIQFPLQRDTDNWHFVEERLGGFSGGRTSAQVIMKLGQFNGICSYILWNHDPGPHREIVYLHPSTWKATMRKDGLLIPKGSDKKQLTLDFVKSRIPLVVDLNRNDKPQPWMFDVADSYCIGRSGFLKCIMPGRSQL